MIAGGRRRPTASVTSVVLVAIGCLAAVSAWPLPSSAATTQFVTNQSVESSLTPWNSPYNSSSRVERVSGGYDGAWAVRATNTTTSSRDVGFKDNPRNVTSTVAGQTYELSVWVRSEVAGTTISLRAKEFAPGGTSLGTAVRTLQAPDTEWHQLQLSYTARANGSSLSFIVFGTAVAANQGIWADLFSASTTTPDPTPPPTTETTTDPTSDPSATTDPSPTTDPSVTTDPSPTDPTSTSDPAPRPNIVVLNLDDMRADSLSAMPLTRQWLADGGTSFVNGYVATPSCCPSRATLFSGRYVHNNGQLGQQTTGFDQSLTTQRYLQEAGYLTGMPASTSTGCR